MTGCLESVKILIDAKADIEGCGDDSPTPLCIAAMYANPEVTKYLLECKADISKSAKCLFLAAADHNTEELIDQLEDEGKDFGRHFLPSKPSAADRMATVKLLVGAGADPNFAREQDGTSTLMCAAMHSGPITIALIEAKADVNAVDNEGNGALFLAVQYQCGSAANALIQAKANVNQENIVKYSILASAVRLANFPMVKSLLAAKAEINHISGTSFTAMDGANENGDKRMMELLEAAGGLTWENLMMRNSRFVHACASGMLARAGMFFPDATIEEKEIALIIAVLRSQTAIVMFLLQNGVDPNSRRAGVPLVEAANTGNINVVSFLLNTKADVNAQSNTGMTAVKAAARRKHREIVTLLLAEAKKQKSDQATKK
jgi:ankyrin repeat protein